MSQACQCQCGKTELLITGKPLTRITCHCQICQEFNRAHFADVTLFLSKDVTLKNEDTVSFKKYTAPPAVQRGTCVSCETPTIERLDIPLCPSITLIPSSLISSGDALPELSGHIFYHRKVHEIDDALPKINGFLKSQLFVVKLLTLGLIKHKTASNK